MSRLLKRALVVIVVLALILTGGLFWLSSRLPDTFLVPEGQSLTLAQMPWLIPKEKAGAAAAQSTPVGGSYNVTLSVMGHIPVKTVRAVVVDRRAVTVCGTPFGIKMFSNGAMVVGFSNIQTGSGYANPAKAAGLKLGDNILSMDGRRTFDNDDVSKAIRLSDGNPIEIVYERDGTEKTTVLEPVRQQNKNSWQAGMWVRDSSAGIGTLTFIDNTTGIYAGLGHPINDSDTGRSIHLRTGEIAPVNIIGYEEGAAGVPGELKGRFTGAPAMGDILKNGPTGVYGHIGKLVKGQDMPVAQAQEVRQADVRILTTISGNRPRWYRAKIEKLSLGETDPNRNMVIHITDPALLETTGGIVQGMSGSPIEQDGRLVGAVTHVLVNDPTRGYGIFAENMLKTADAAAQAVSKQVA